MTQADLAQAVGAPQPSIARIERGAVLPRTATLIELLAATGHQLTVEPNAPGVDSKAIRQRLAMSVPRRTRLALGLAGKDPTTSPIRILRRLRLFAVPFVLIGELAEVAHGSPTTAPNAVEICHASTDVGGERLARARKDLGPDVGRLRAVTETAAGDTYELLARNAIRMHVDAGILVQVAGLHDLIRTRRARCTPEDDEAAAILSSLA